MITAKEAFKLIYDNNKTFDYFTEIETAINKAISENSFNTKVTLKFPFNSIAYLSKIITTTLKSIGYKVENYVESSDGNEIVFSISWDNPTP